MADELQHIVDAQLDVFRRYTAADPPELSHLLRRALTPDEAYKALLKERPLLDALRALVIPEPSPQELRAEAAAVGLIGATPHDLDYRRLYPGLDVGIYASNHSIGKASALFLPGLVEHLVQLPVLGREAFERGGWMDVIEDFRQNVSALVGGDLLRGDVVPFENWSDAHSALLFSVGGGRLVTTEGHFTSAHYLHRAWAKRTDGDLVVVPVDAQGCVPTERLVDALSPDTTVISLSHGFYRNGFLQDLTAIGEAVMDICPDAVFLLDAYQTLGTVPVGVGRLPLRAAVKGGSVKQLHAGTGGGFAWISHLLLADIEPDRFGWWAHAEPLAFADEFQPGRGGRKLWRGAPSLMPMVALNTELSVFATSGSHGDIGSAIKRARLVTSRNIELAVERARELGLEVWGPAEPGQRAAFFAIRVDQGPQMAEVLADEGVIVDFRADQPGGDEGLIRLSSSAAGFAYELLYAVERLAHWGQSTAPGSKTKVGRSE